MEGMKNGQVVWDKPRVRSRHMTYMCPRRRIMNFMNTSLFLTLIFGWCSVLAQDYSKLDLFVLYSEFYDTDEMIIVRGIVPDDKEVEYGEICQRRSKGRFPIKLETELDSLDLKSHLLFAGPINAFRSLERFAPSPFTILEKGFRFGPYEFADPLDAIYLFSDDGTRLFYLGNSLEAIPSLYPMEVGMEQYMIVQDYAVTHHGYLSDGKFDPKKHVDMVRERNQVLLRKEMEHFIFYHPENLWSIERADSSVPNTFCLYFS